MSARFAATFPQKKRPGFPLFVSCLFTLLFLSAASSFGQTTRFIRRVGLFCRLTNTGLFMPGPSRRTRP